MFQIQAVLPINTTVSGTKLELISTEYKGVLKPIVSNLNFQGLSNCTQAVYTDLGRQSHVGYSKSITPRTR